MRFEAHHPPASFFTSAPPAAGVEPFLLAFKQVQKVYFRKHTEEEANRLKLVGWCMNTDAGTVVGEVQGPMDMVELM